MILAAVVLIAALAAGILLTSLLFGGQIGENVTTGSISLGGMTKAEARKLIRSTWQDIVLSLPTGELRLTPEESGFRLDDKALAKEAASQKGPAALSLAPYLTLDETAIRTVLEAAAQQLEQAFVPASHALEGEIPDLTEGVFQPDTPLPTLAVTTAVSSYVLDVDAAWELIRESCAAGTFEIDLSSAVRALEAEAPDVEAIF